MILYDILFYTYHFVTETETTCYSKIKHSHQIPVVQRDFLFPTDIIGSVKFKL